MSYPNVDILYLNEQDMLKAGVDDVVGCTNCMEELLKTLYRRLNYGGTPHTQADLDRLNA